MLENLDSPGKLDIAASTRLDCYLGNNIRQARNRYGLSVTELCYALCLQEDLLTKYEAGLERISASMLYNIAVALNVTLASLFGVTRHRSDG